MDKAGIAAELAGIISRPVDTDMPMSSLTTWKIGGPADFVVYPATDSELTGLMQYLYQADMPWTVVGNGSNLLVGDKGYRGVIIKMGDSFAGAVWHGMEVEVEAGTLMGSLALEAAEKNAAGIEFGRGIPGSVGGAVRMNAGAYGNNICQYIKKVTAIDYQGKSLEINKDDITYTYRDSSLAYLDAIISKVTLELELGDREKIMTQIKDYQRRRGISQPLEYPSCGSVFRNPPDYYVGRLVELTELKGQRIGDAKISDKHGNFIINLGAATANDVVQLIELVKQRVYDYSGIRLEPEVKMIGDF